MKALEFIFSSFWHWLGFTILFYAVCRYAYVFTYNFYQSTLKHFTIMKHGYPVNCDADGDFHKPEEMDED
jgi:hypothetical protein